MCAGLGWGNEGADALFASIVEFKSLFELDLRENNLTTVPGAIGQVQTLTTLVLRNNGIISLPAAIVGLPALVTLDLRGNPIAELPSAMAAMDALLDIKVDRGVGVPLTLARACQAIGTHL